MNCNVTIEAGKLNAALQEMHAMLSREGIPMQQIVNHEVGKVMERAIVLTKTATKATVRKNYTEKEWTTFEGKRYKTSWRFPRALWLGIKAKREAALKRRLEAIGLAKATWLEIANKLGLTINAPGYVRAAKRPFASNADNVSVTQATEGDKAAVEIINRSPLIKWTEGRYALESAIAGRRKFFEQNLKRGVFDKMDSIAKKYPGLISTKT